MTAVYRSRQGRAFSLFSGIYDLILQVPSIYSEGAWQRNTQRLSSGTQKVTHSLSKFQNRYVCEQELLSTYCKLGLLRTVLEVFVVCNLHLSIYSVCGDLT